MSDPRPEPHKLREASAWFARLGKSSITTEALREFGTWRQDPANDAAYQEVEATWSKAGGLADDPDILRATDAALARKVQPRPNLWARLPWLGWSVALATLALSGGLVVALNQYSPTYETQVGEQRLVRLEDGSRVHLNTDSRVKVEYRTGERRLVITRGEAFFDVAHDASRPFIVAAGDARVRATGTKFDVRRDDGTVRVSLLEGSVRVRSDDKPGEWTLAPNQQLTVAKGGAVTVATSIDAARATSWTTGRLVFHETPLAAAVAEVNRYADHKVELDESLGHHLVNGVFDVGDTDAFVKGVASLFDLKATAAPNGAIRLQPADRQGAA